MISAIMSFAIINENVCLLLFQILITLMYILLQKEIVLLVYIWSRDRGLYQSLDTMAPLLIS